MSCIRRLFAVSLCALCLPLASWADETQAVPALTSPSNRDWLLARYDVNGDQVISTEEISQKRDKVFAKMDLNHDGNVSVDEFTQVDLLKRQPIITARFSKLDADRDGTVSQDEYRNYLGSFKQFDHDGNGHITSAEIDSTRAVEPAKSSGKTHCLLWVCVRSTIKD
jgi:Ca2+-binding EF-hand superfamily protein